jgi:Zn-dependent protease with chaperone function
MTDPPVRPHLLAYPSATVVQFVLLVIATLTAGLFVGNWAHHTAEGDRWLQVVAQCEAAGVGAPEGFAGLLAREAAFHGCAAPAERRRAAYAIGGLIVAAASGIAVLLLAPQLISRRRQLSPPEAKYAPALSRFAQLAGQAGLRAPPQVMIGTAKLRDAFSYGLPGRYRVALPRAIVIQLRPWDGKPPRSAAEVPRRLEAEAVVAHELAHVARQDVALAWAATAAGYALLPMLVLPILVDAIVGDLSVMPDYAWRAGLLGAVIVLIRAALLRSREHDADLRAVGHGTTVPTLDATLAKIPRRRVRWRGILANHPDAETRMAVVRCPAMAVRAGFVDGLSLAFLAALLPSLIDGVVVAWLFDTGQQSITNVVYAVLTGMLTGAGLGPAWWRAALIRRLVGTGPRLAPLVAGVFTGFVAGAAASLGGVGTGPFGGENPLLLTVTALAAAGATVVTAGLGELWADAAPRLPRAWMSWVAAVLVPGVLFTVVLWAAAVVQKIWGGLGWAWASTTLQSFLDRGPVVAAVSVLAAAAVVPVVLARPGAPAPAWLVDSGPRPYWPEPARGTGALALVASAAAGLAGVVVLIGYRLVAGPPADRIEAAQRYYTVVLLAAAVAAVAAVGLMAAVPGRGAATVLLAVPVATVVTMAGFIALNTALGGDLRFSFVVGVLQAPIAPALLAAVLVLSAGAVSPAARLAPAHRGKPALILPVVTITLAAGVAAGTVVATRDVLVPVEPIRILEQGPAGAPTTAPDQAQQVAEYRDVIAPTIASAHATIAADVRRIDADPVLDGPGRADAVRTTVLPRLRDLRDYTQVVRAEAPAVRAAHAQCVDALDHAVTAFEDFATAYDNGDAQAFARAQQVLVLHAGEWQAWQAAVEAL